MVLCLMTLFIRKQKIEISNLKSQLLNLEQIFSEEIFCKNSAWVPSQLMCLSIEKWQIRNVKNTLLPLSSQAGREPTLPRNQSLAVLFEETE